EAAAAGIVEFDPGIVFTKVVDRAGEIVGLQLVQPERIVSGERRGHGVGGARREEDRTDDKVGDEKASWSRAHRHVGAIVARPEPAAQGADRVAAQRGEELSNGACRTAGAGGDEAEAGAARMAELGADDA